MFAVVMMATGFAAEPAKSAGGNAPVVMRPFKVMSAWLEIQPLLKNGVIESVRIASVQPRSPAAAAGIVAGMRIVELQGIALPGLPETEFIKRLEALPPADRLELKVRGILDNTVTPLTLLFTGALPVRDETTATVPKPPAREPMTEAETRKLLESVRRALQDEMARVRQEARDTGRGRSDPQVMLEATRKLRETPASHLALLCDAAVKGDADAMLTNALSEAINGRSDYEPHQREIVLKYLPKLPDLIVVLDRMKWAAGTEAVIAAGWKKARQDEREGTLNYRGSRYARLAAKHGLTDALVAIARTVKNPNAGKRPPQLLAHENETLKTLVPIDAGTPAALAEFVVKNKDRLVFEPAKGVYVLKK